MLYLARSMVRKGPRLRTFSLGCCRISSCSDASRRSWWIEPDSTAALLGVTLFAMLFVGGGALAASRVARCLLIRAARHLRGELAARTGSAASAVFLGSVEHPRDAGFQLVQSFLGLRLGRALRREARRASRRCSHLPEAHTDFIFSVIGEEPRSHRGARPGRSPSRCWLSAALRVALNHPTVFRAARRVRDDDGARVAGRHQHGGRAGSPCRRRTGYRPSERHYGQMLWAR